MKPRHPILKWYNHYRKRTGAPKGSVYPEAFYKTHEGVTIKLTGKARSEHRGFKQSDCFYTHISTDEPTSAFFIVEITHALAFCAQNQHFRAQSKRKTLFFLAGFVVF